MPSGGKREGSGRKPDIPGAVKVQMTLTLHQETKDKLKQESKKKNITPGALVEMLLKNEEIRNL